MFMYFVGRNWVTVAPNESFLSSIMNYKFCLVHLKDKLFSSQRRRSFDSLQFSAFCAEANFFSDYGSHKFCYVDVISPAGLLNFGLISRPTVSCGSSSFDYDPQHRSIFTSSNSPFRSKWILPETNTQPVYFDMETIRPTESIPEPVVKEEVEESSRVKQAPPPSLSSCAPLGQEEPYDIFMDVNPQVIGTDKSCIGISAIDLMKDPEMLKKEDLDEDLDEGMQQETQKEVHDEEDSSDAGEHLDPKDKAYTPKGSSSKKKQHRCEVCQKVFYDTTGLRRHLRVHTGEKAYECDVCQKHFRTKQHLTYHLRVHTGEKPFSCEVCQKCFSSHSSHRRHMLIHSGEKPFSCDVCKKTFRVKGTLQDHMRSHTGEKPHECKDCEEKFSYLMSLKRHRIRCHP